jgi:cytochrome P450
VEKVRASQEAGIIRDRETVFDSLLTSDLPAEDKTTRRLAAEGAALLGGGTETVSWALSVISFHLSNEPALLERATKELRTVVDDPLHLPGWTALSNLPYLRGMIFEGLRLSYGVSERLVRVIRGENLVYPAVQQKAGVAVEENYVIPDGTPIGMTSWMLHHDEEVFPDAAQFRPERWVDGSEAERRELEKHLMAFGRGNRQCIGMQ